MKLPFQVAFDMLTAGNDPGTIQLDVDPVSGTIRIDLMSHEEQCGPSMILSMEQARQLASPLIECAEHANEPECELPVYNVTVGAALDSTGCPVEL